MRYFKTTISVISAMLLIGSTVHAQIDVSTDFSKGKVSVSGTSAGPNEYVFLQIVKSDVDKESLKDFLLTQSNQPIDVVKYNNQVISDENGKYSIEANLDSGVYHVFASGNNLLEVSDDFIFTSVEDYELLIDGLNTSSTDLEAFKTYLSANILELGFDFELNNSVDLNEAADILSEYIKVNPLTADDGLKNSNIFKTAVIAEALNEGISIKLDDYLNNIYITDEKITNDFQLISDTEEKSTYFHSKLINKEYTTIEEFQAALRDAVVLTIIKYPEGYQNLKGIIEKYSAELNISISSIPDSIWRTMSGDYSDIESFKQSLNAKIAQLSYNSGNYGGGSSGASSKKNNAIVAPIVNTTVSQENKKVEMNFKDLNSVPWAYTAISALADRKIISGVSETEFHPNDYVTREAFVKMCICALGEELDCMDNSFDDVENGTWFEKYVNKAVQIGIVNGISDNKFGTGLEITRQDMAVMIYRILSLKGIEMNNSANAGFADAEMIAEYARTAVNTLAEQKIVSGIGENRFNPKGNATRAEAAQMIYGILKHL